MGVFLKIVNACNFVLKAILAKFHLIWLKLLILLLLCNFTVILQEFINSVNKRELKKYTCLMDFGIENRAYFSPINIVNGHLTISVCK